MKNIVTIIGSGLLIAAAGVNAANLKITFTNNSAVSGTYLTPLWLGFHGGDKTVFTTGESASLALEALAEDGNSSLLNDQYMTSGLVGSAPLSPQGSFESHVMIADDGSESFVNVAAMVLPSSDFFIANEHSKSFSLKSLLAGDATSVTYTIGRVFDAGTEINDFATSAGNPLVGLAPGQTMANQGASENGVVTEVSSNAYLNYLNINGSDISSLDFNETFPLATIRFELSDVQEVPVPAALPLFASASLGLLALRRKRQK